MEKDAYWSIRKCIDENIYLYEEELEKLYTAHEMGKMSHAATLVISRINELAQRELSANKTMLDRYLSALENHSLCGYKFDTPELTIGKIYLFFIWAFWNKKGNKANCMLLDEYFLSQINAKRNSFLARH